MIRYFCPITHSTGEWTTYGDIAFGYFKAFLDADFQVRVLGCQGGDFDQTGINLSDPGSRWQPYSKNFIWPISSRYTNVVCAENGELVRLYTVGVKNVAITAVLPNLPNEKEVEVLGKYDLVICPFKEDVWPLRRLGVDIFHVDPDASELDRFIRDI